MMPDWKYIILHHSWSPDHDTFDWDNIVRYHTYTKHWADVGYHFGVERIDGFNHHVIVGRPLTMKGAHCRGMNSKAIGVCFVGKYDNWSPDDKMLTTAAKRIIAPLMTIFDIPLENIKGHRAYSPKTCPGKKFDIDYFRNIVKLYLDK